MSSSELFSAGSPSFPGDGQKPVYVEPDSWEIPLFIILLVISILEWVALAITIIGISYVLLFGLFFYFIHIGFIYHIRSSAIKLGPEQMPALYGRVVVLANRLGLKKTPDAYLHQSGGVLNAFATRFGRSKFVVLNSALVEACGDNPEALDFIIGHEVGHLHRNHLRWRLLLTPALLIPFLGSAYSRACEFTCDRYGFAGTDDSRKSLQGLIILAAGPKFAAAVDLRQFIRQQRDVKSFFMQIAQWTGSHPSLSKRVAALGSLLVRSA